MPDWTDNTEVDLEESPVTQTLLKGNIMKANEREGRSTTIHQDNCVIKC